MKNQLAKFTQPELSLLGSSYLKRVYQSGYYDTRFLATYRLSESRYQHSKLTLLQWSILTSGQIKKHTVNYWRKIEDSNSKKGSVYRKRCSYCICKCLVLFAINLFRYKKGFSNRDETLYAVGGPVALAPSSLDLLRYNIDMQLLPMQSRIQCPKINAFRLARKSKEKEGVASQYYSYINSHMS